MVQVHCVKCVVGSWTHDEHAPLSQSCRLLDEGFGLLQILIFPDCFILII